MRLSILVLTVLVVPAWLSLAFREPRYALSNVVSAINTLKEAAERRARIEGRKRRLFARIEGRLRLARQLSAGQITFRDAVPQLRALFTGAELQHHLSCMRRWQVAGSDEEHLCRDLIESARQQLPEDAEYTVLARLEQELAAHLSLCDVKNSKGAAH